MFNEDNNFDEDEEMENDDEAIESTSQEIGKEERESEWFNKLLDRVARDHGKWSDSKLNWILITKTVATRIEQEATRLFEKEKNNEWSQVSLKKVRFSHPCISFMLSENFYSANQKGER